jgi:hypothetical protein
MTEPITFPATTARIGLPLLFAGQAQKEFFVNQALSILDALADGAVIASLDAPPVSASDGDCYRVTGSPSGVWNAHADSIAIAIGGSWHFVVPAEGMLVFDREAGNWLCFRSGWQMASAPPPPYGGAVIDVEARAALAQLIDGLQSLGLVSAAQPDSQ